MSTVDYFVLFVLMVGAVTGHRKGLITGMARFLGKIAAVVIAVLFHKPFEETLEPIFGLRSLVEENINTRLAKISVPGSGAVTALGDPKGILDPILQQTASTLTDYVLSIGSVLLLFFLITLILNLVVGLMVQPLAQSLGFLNRGGGVLFGLCGGLILSALVFGLANPFLLVAYPAQISQSIFYPWLMTLYQILITLPGNPVEVDLLRDAIQKLPIFE